MKSGPFPSVPDRICSIVGAPVKEDANLSLLARRREILSPEVDMLKSWCLAMEKY